MNQDQDKNKNEQNMHQYQNERKGKNERGMHQNKDEQGIHQGKSERGLHRDKNDQGKSDRGLHLDKIKHKNERSDHNKKSELKSKDQDIITEIDEAPLTKERKVPEDLTALGNAGLPRATIAASKEVPEGTPGSSTKKTVLQQHVEFWDTDHDSVITPLDTWKGFRKLGFSLAFSAIAVGVINGGFSYPTQKSWIPILGNPFFKVYVDTLNKAKHGSDSETFDTEGRFVPEKFEEVFSKYDTDHKGGLSFNDIINVIRGNANVFDPFGWWAAVFEWGTLYLLCSKNGVVYKEDVRSCYDGSLFFRMEEEEEKRQKGVPIIKSSKDITMSIKEE